MRVALVGATGQVGKPLLRELVERGHLVTAITTHPDLVAAHGSVTVAEVDANDHARLVPAIAGHDVVVTAIQYTKTDHAGLIGAVKEAGVARYFATGGSGTLLAPGTTTRIMDAPAFPPAFAEPARAAAHFWELLEQESELNWVYLAPPPGIGPGERTGAFRRGGRELLTREDGQVPSISFYDYAIAIADELEQPTLTRNQYTVAY